MKKKSGLICGIILIATLFGGCGVEIPTLSEEQNDLVTEYAANLIVKHSSQVKRSLLNDKELEAQLAIEAEERAKEQKRKQLAEDYAAALQNGSSSVEENTEKESDNEEDSVEVQTSTIQNLGEFFGLNDFSVSYKEYQLMQSYPEDDNEDYFFAMDATSGKQLCVVKFAVVNNSSQEMDFNMLEKQGRFILTINGDKRVQNQSTLLLDDLAAYKGMIAPGANEDMVLIYEIDESVTVESMIMDVRYGSESGTIVLQ